MTRETQEHLNQVESAVQKSKELLGRHGYPDDSRTVIVIGLVDQLLEHHGAMLLLIRSGKIGSAFALARSIFESMYRGLCINFCATEEQIQKFERDDDIGLGMTQLSRAIDDRYRAEGFFEDLKNRGWAALCSYTHTGMLQLGRRFTGHVVEPGYSDAQIMEITTSITTCALILISKFLAVQNHPTEALEAEQLIETYGPARHATRPKRVMLGLTVVIIPALLYFAFELLRRH